MTKKQNHLYWILFLFISLNTYSQQEKIPAVLKLAEQASQNLQYAKAVTYYQQYLKKQESVQTKFGQQAVQALADCYWKMRNYAAADYWYRQLTNDTPVSGVELRKAELQARQGNYSAAAGLLSKIPDQNKKMEGYMHPAKLVKDSADWTIGYLNINTPYYREYSPLLAGTSLLWSTNEPTIRNKEGIMGWDGFSYSKLLFLQNKGEAQRASIPESIPYDSMVAAAGKLKVLAVHYNNADKDLLKQPLTLPNDLQTKRLGDKKLVLLEGFGNYKYNQGHASWLNQSNELFFSINQQENKLKNIRKVGIAKALLQDGKLSGIKFINTNDKEVNQMHPAIHPDGSKIVFASDKQGGSGGFDLYLTQKVNDSTWSEPQAISALNTPGDEVFPSFNQQGELYFSSNGLEGLGGLDLYRASGDSYQIVYHLPSPVNSGADEFGFTANTDGKSGYFTTDRLGTDDIFEFQYEPVYLNLKGNVISRLNNKGVPQTPILLYPAGGQEGKEEWAALGSTETDADGNFIFKVRPNHDYKIVLNYKGETQQISFNTENKFKDQQVGTFYVDKEPVLIVDPDPKNFIIHFDFDQSVLTPASVAILDEAIALLKSNNTLLIWLDAHTDFEGADGYNQSLSNKRLEKTVQYLTEKGIMKERIIGAYFGESKPVELSKKWKDLWKNRRVEIKIWK